MLKIICGCLLSMTMLISPASASLPVDVGGIRFNGTVDAMEQRLHLYGAGMLKYMVWIKAYAGALYLPASVTADDALAPVAKQLVLAYFHNIKSEDFAKATRKKIADNVTAEQARVLESRVDKLVGLYRDVVPGDRYALTYLPGEGTLLSLNDEHLGLMPGDDFARAVFSIWLGANPIDENFRDQLLRRL